MRTVNKWLMGMSLMLPVLGAPAVGGTGLPNVVMIMADDWGWSDIAAHRRYQGLPDPIPTPNLDRLVAEGMLFTDAHAPAALCAPTRFSMMTGSNPYRNGAPTSRPSPTRSPPQGRRRDLSACGSIPSRPAPDAYCGGNAAFHRGGGGNRAVNNVGKWTICPSTGCLT